MRTWRLLCLSVLLVACGGAPTRAPETEPAEPIARRAKDVPDDCTQQPGKPPPQPLIREYTGLAAGARCQREVYTIMGGVTHFLGVKCEYCHVPGDKQAMTHRKRIANWMARDLIPSLALKNGKAKLWCNDCHDGKAKFLGAPRDQKWAVEWMLTHMVDDLQGSDGAALRCRDCHGGNVGTPEFSKKVILTDQLPGRREAKGPPTADVPDAGAPAVDAGAVGADGGA
ncbi:MAG: hypothetical protein KC776_36185 [Myxococcales bacterium]|nr:hypothetical protein [Myxococcales bacterium]MCB9583109.1 hypothetical protein [Polyangiaceae bacterium]